MVFGFWWWFVFFSYDGSSWQRKADCSPRFFPVAACDLHNFCCSVHILSFGLCAFFFKLAFSCCQGTALKYKMRYCCSEQKWQLL